ncbi:hypothetical protein ZIOFF_024709 [Zingiber officinale]|uniref:Uncharacterized protein n=1 Tax=Zingiber officinale TaxID=94328 RepID=A0A8J5H0R8_ZINOF|nr:hypothetical protein ZIOFF_024709 [Zingiber officinale]
MKEVVLHVYDVTNSGSEKTNNTIPQINRIFKDRIGLEGIFHSAIQVPFFFSPSFVVLALLYLLAPLYLSNDWFGPIRHRDWIRLMRQALYCIAGSSNGIPQGIPLFLRFSACLFLEFPFHLLSTLHIQANWFMEMRNSHLDFVNKALEFSVVHHLEILWFKKSDIGAWPADSSDALCQLPRLHPRSPHAVGCPARPSPRGSAAASTKAAADASFPIVASTGGDAGARIALSDLIPWANAASASAEGKAVSGSETTTTATAERDAFPCDAFNGRSAPLRVPRMWKGILFVPGPRRPQKQPPEAPLGAGARIAVSDLIPWANAAASASAGGKAVFAFVPGAETRTAAAERDAFSCDAFNGRSAPLRVPRMRKSILFAPGTRRPQKHPPEAAVAQRLPDRKAETRQGEKSNAMPSISLTECSPMNWGLGIDLNQPAIEKD